MVETALSTLSDWDLIYWQRLGGAGEARWEFLDR